MVEKTQEIKNDLLCFPFTRSVVNSQAHSNTLQYFHKTFILKKGKMDAALSLITGR